MQRERTKFIFLTSALLFFLSLVALPTHAQTPQGINLQISPLPILLNAKPGETVSSDLRVRNGGSQTERLRTVVKTFKTEGPDGKVVFKDPGPGDDYVNWVSFNKTVFEAPAGQWQTVKMSVSLPSTAAFGYYFAVQFERANPVKPTPGTTGIEGAVAIFVLLNAERPGATRQAEVKTFSVDKKFYEFLPAKFSVRVRNKGNIHLAPYGNILIKRGGSQVGSLNVNAAGGYILPGSNRLYTAEWKDGFPVYEIQTQNGQQLTDAKGNPKRKLSWNFSKVSHLKIGHYTANLLLIYNDGQRDIPVTGTVSFWVVPWRVILLAIAIPVIPALAVYFLMRWRFRKRLDKERSTKKTGNS